MKDLLRRYGIGVLWIVLAVFGVDLALGFSWNVALLNAAILIAVVVEVNRRTQAQRKDMEDH